MNRPGGEEKGVVGVHGMERVAQVVEVVFAAEIASVQSNAAVSSFVKNEDANAQVEDENA